MAAQLISTDKQEIIQMIERAGFEAVERDTVYNRVERIAA
jgi:2-iminoacetate synthase ThiH